MESTKNKGQNEDSETCKNFFQIANLLFRNGVQRHFLRKSLKVKILMISIIRLAKNDYYEASDSVLQIDNLFRSNAVQREFHTSSKVTLGR